MTDTAKSSAIEVPAPCRDCTIDGCQTPEVCLAIQKAYRAKYPVTPSSTAALNIPDGLHPETADLVVRFAEALAEKLRKAEVKYGYSDFWKYDDWKEECQAKLLEHMAKGDPRDVANYCAFMWHHGWPTVAPSFGPIDGNPNNTALENWFPISAEELERLRKGVKCQYAEDVGMPEHRCAVECQYAAKPPVAWVRQSSGGGVSIYQGDGVPRDGCRTVGDDGSGGQWIPIHAPRSTGIAPEKKEGKP